MANHESIQQIAKATGVSQRNVIRFLAALYKTTEKSVAYVGTSMVESSIELIRQQLERKKYL